MASGHVNRTNRPNTWLHRPSLRREDSPCQPGAVHTWHQAAQNDVRCYVGFRGVKRNCCKQNQFDAPGPTAVISRVEILQRSSLLRYEVCYPFSGKTRGACSACPDSGNSGLAERLARAEDRVIHDGLRPMSLLRWRRADIARDFTRAKHALGRMSWLMMKACADAMS
jgi:hypothetical protein